MRYAALLMLGVLTACATAPGPAPLPAPPQIVEVPVTRYVEVPDEYLRPCRWIKDAPPSKVYEVAAGRQTCLEKYEADRDSIRAIRGSPVR